MAWALQRLWKRPLWGSLAGKQALSRLVEFAPEKGREGSFTEVA